MEEQNKQLILGVTFSNEKNTYDVCADKGTSAAEMIFGMAVSIKAIHKVTDLPIEEMEKQLHKYLTDPQYDEVKEKEEQNAV